MGGEVRVSGAVDGHFCRTEGWCGSGGNEGVMAMEGRIQVGERDVGRIASLGVRAVFESRL